MTRRGCCLVAAILFTCLVLYYGCTISVVGYSAMSNFSESQVRATQARALSDMRTYQTALEKYKDTNQKYPDWSLTAPPLTTPVSYFDFQGVMIPDAFSKAPKNSPESWMRYATNGTDFLIWSIGPDGEAQITGEADLTAGYPALTLKEYDVTNGSVSPGDIIRTSLEPPRSIQVRQR